MSEVKFKAPKVVMDRLNSLRKENYTIFELLSDLMGTVLQNYETEMTENGVTENQIDQAIIDYVIWKKDTIELEHEPHYVIQLEQDHIHTVIYARGELFPISRRGLYDRDYTYRDGWPKEEAERLNVTIKGKLVEVK